jgi:hypothetical protein
VFVNLPICLAQLHLVLSAGFPFSAIAAGLLWEQVLLIFVVSLPIAALASITSGILPFILATLILLTAGFSMTEQAIRAATPWPAAFEWVRGSFVDFLLAGVTLAVLYVQYRTRRTLFSRSFAAAAIALGAGGFWFMPLSVALGVQSRLSKQPFDSSSLQFSLASGSRKPFHEWKAGTVPVHLPTVAQGVPDGATLRGDAFSVSIHEPGDKRLALDSRRPPNVSRQTSRSGAITFHTTVFVDSSYFKSGSEKPVTVQASLFLTAFGNARAKTIPLQEKPVYVMDGLQCYLGIFDHVTCRSAFRWPARLVDSKLGTNTNNVTQLISYSPFSAELKFNPFESHWATGAPSTREVTIQPKEPLTHFRRDFEFHDVRLADFTAP